MHHKSPKPLTKDKTVMAASAAREESPATGLWRGSDVTSCWRLPGRGPAIASDLLTSYLRHTRSLAGGRWRTVGQALQKSGIKSMSTAAVPKMIRYRVKYHAKAESDIHFQIWLVTLGHWPMTSLFNFCAAHMPGTGGHYAALAARLQSFRGFKRSNMWYDVGPMH